MVKNDIRIALIAAMLLTTMVKLGMAKNAGEVFKDAVGMFQMNDGAKEYLKLNGEVTFEDIKVRPLLQQL